MRLMVSCLLCVGLTSFGSHSAVARTLEFQGACTKGPQVTIAAAGDLLFHRSLQRQAYRNREGTKRFFTPLAEFLKKADIAYANLEGPTAHGVSGFGRVRRDPGRRLDLSVYNGYPAFNYHPSVIDGIVDVGFDVVSTANNHALDRGAVGVDRTIENLNRRGLAYTGTRPRNHYAGPPAMGSWATFVRRRGFTTAWLACTEMTNGLPDRKKQVLKCYKQRKKVLSEIKRLKARHDVDAVFLTPHWGAEYVYRPAARQRRLARAAIEAGATAVIGTHAHVVQPWEKVTTKDGREGLIIYSTGNFISGQVAFMRRAGVLAFLRLVRSRDDTVQISAVGYIPTWVTFSGGHKVNPNEGKRGSASARRQQLRILPSGNAVAARWPLRLPGKCQPPDVETAVVNTNSYPARVPQQTDQLVRTLQKELARVGCAPGSIDGVWGGRSKRALARFARHTGLSLAPTPSPDVLGTVTAHDGRACPVRKVASTASRRKIVQPAGHALPFGEKR